MQMIEDAAKDLQNEFGVGVVAENYYEIPRAAAEQIQKRVADLATSKEQEAMLLYNALKEVAEETKPTFGPESIANITQKNDGLRHGHRGDLPVDSDTRRRFEACF